jgi:hypothetical protein
MFTGAGGRCRHGSGSSRGLVVSRNGARHGLEEVGIRNWRGDGSLDTVFLFDDEIREGTERALRRQRRQLRREGRGHWSLELRELGFS